LKRFICVIALCLVGIPSLLFAAEFGVVLSGQFTADNTGDNATEDSAVSPGQTSSYAKTILAPWVSFPIGASDFYASAGIHGDYADKFNVIPDLFRLEFSFNPIAPLTVRAGRFSWQDPSRIVAKGSFDGADALLDLGRVQLGVSALYTGLLYKDSTDINISPTDQTDYSADFDWSNFSTTYFAPRRLLTALYGDFSGFPFQRGNLHAGLMAQFDLSDADEAFHTQYLVIRYTFVYRQFDLAASGAAELENTTEDGLRSAYAFSLEGGWQTGFLKLRDRASAGLNWASGEGPYTAAFFPVIREAQGLVLKPWLSGMTTLWAQYKARLLPSLSADLTGRYFIRTDSASFSDPDLDDSNYLLGLELSSTLLWVPFSDLSFSLAGGIFLPQTGNAMNGPVRWSLTAGAIFSF